MKAAIPAVYNSGNVDVDRAFEAIKQNIESMNGQQKNAVKLLPLASTATLADVIERCNALLERLQG